jgi:hypothetical protein
VTYGGYRPWTGDVQVDLVELGDRVTTAYDEAHSVVYRLAEAAGYAREDVVSWLPERYWRSSRDR